MRLLPPKGSLHMAVLGAALFFTVGSAQLAAQNGTVTGSVRDAVSQAPLAGAQISIAGTTLGMLTNNVGRYLLVNVPAGEQTVRVDLIGYGSMELTVTVPAGGAATADFNIRQDAIALEGVVVTGTAGQARRREVGNSISQVVAEDIQYTAVTDFGDVLQGRTTGIQVNDHSGQVGAASQIRLRGNNSLLQQGNNPLIYVDGVRLENNPIGSDDEGAQTPSAFDMINPADIERMEVIKGPAATTLYGTEASSGVIQIFTKRGVAGAPAWTASVEQGLSVMPHQGPGADVNPSGLFLNTCRDPSILNHQTGEIGVDEPGCPESGSWFRNARHQVYNLSVRGGGQTATYFVSGQYGDRQGVVDPQGADNYNVRANITFQPAEGFNVQLNSSYARRNITWIPNGNNASGLYLNVLRGDRGYTPGNDDSLVLENEILTHLDQYVTSLSVGWAPNSMFSHRMNVGLDYTSSDFIDFKGWGFYEEATGDREIDQQFDRNLTFDYSGTFSYSPLDNITSDFSWGGQVYEEFNYTMNGFDELFAGPGQQVLGDGNNPRVFENRIIERSGGFFVQEVLGLNDKLFLTGGIRWDGFSTFGEGFGLAAYPKLQAAYTISDEDFFPFDWAETFKLRAAWGQSGKAPGAFDAKRTYEATSADEQVPAVIIANLGNADLGPEISTELEYGADASFLNGRVIVEFTAFDQTTRDALICVQEAPSGGTEECTWRNLGEVQNWGTETMVNFVPVRTDNIEWDIGVNFTTNDSEITDLGPLEDLGTSRQLGFPLWIRWDDTLTNPDAIGELPDYEKGNIGNLFPTETVGLNTRLTLWRSLTLDLVGEGQYGMVRPIGIAYQNVRRRVWPGDGCPAIQDMYYSLRGSGSSRVAQMGLPASDIARCIGPYSDQGMWTDLADFFKIRSASLTYRLPDGMVPGARSAQIGVAGKNLMTWTNYRGLDPEANDNGFGDSTPNEYYNMAPPRIFILNFSVNF
ncbi:MAG: TonB-dependent receptor [Gemmatimonadota bacterium]|nr:TonB-dependent receptor [Gemmatimonadota bacterium]